MPQRKKHHSSSRKAQLAALIVTAGLGASSYATTLATDDFETYAVGALAGNNGGTGWGGAWGGTPTVAVTPTVIAGGLSYTNGDVFVNGGSQSVQFAHGDENAAGISDSLLSRALASSQSDTVYFSMLFRDNSRPGRRKWCSSASGCGNSEARST